MDLSTSYQEKLIDIDNKLSEISKKKNLVETDINKIEDDLSEFDKDGDQKNRFLDRSVRNLIDEFVLTWHKIMVELLDISQYSVLRKDEWWNFLIDLFNMLKKIFWVNERLFHIGVGFVIVSFFVFFIFVTK